VLSHLAKIAVERGGGRFEWSMLDWNVDAIRFYERLGAKATDGWTTFRVTGEALEKLARETRAPQTSPDPVVVQASRLHWGRRPIVCRLLFIRRNS